MDLGARLVTPGDCAGFLDMNSERWQQVKKVLDGALALESGSQSAYVEQACGGDSELQGEVKTLLRHHLQAPSHFLNQPVADIPGAVETNLQGALSRVGRRVGVYQILEEIGSGGMGEVYRAARVDGLYEKQVAVKLVRGGYDTAALLERFRTERQILASLDHPNIARLLDGGTTEDGVPYLVMELIEGTRIDEYCDQGSLSITARLELFRQVCSAVQYAHQHLVIHRDIKPGNILVTGDGTPKLLDFGIAKLLGPEGGSETSLLRPMTPEYASPEQIRGESITTATDVYSLGVVLYGLLTGHSPYATETGAPHELAGAICESEPARPSSVVTRAVKPVRAAEGVAITPMAISQSREGSLAKLRRRLTGDLDNILLTALRKEPQRRYGSVEQLSEDIRRHLEGLPIKAFRDSWTYRTGKFVRRHVTGVAATGVVILTLILGLGMTLREKRMAERRFNDVRKLANSLIFEIDNSIRDLPGSTPARKLLVTRALEYLDSLSREAKGDPSLQRELATAYERVGDVLGHPYAANLGDSAGAIQSYRKALVIRESLATANPGDQDMQRELVGNYIRIANTLEVTADLDGALSAIQKALPIAEKLAATKADPVTLDHLGGGYYFAAGLLARTGKPDAALESFRKAASTHERALLADGKNMFIRTHLAGDSIGIARLLDRNGQHAQAAEMEDKAIGILDEASKANSNNATLREYLAEAINYSAHTHQELGNAAEGLARFERSHQMFAELAGADAKNPLAQVNLAFSQNGIGQCLRMLGRLDEAGKAYGEAASRFEKMAPATTTDRYVRSGLANAYSGMGNVYESMAMKPRVNASQRRQNWIQARSWFERSQQIWNEKVKRSELESDEHVEVKIIADAIARCDQHLAQK